MSRVLTTCPHNVHTHIPESSRLFQDLSAAGHLSLSELPHTQMGLVHSLIPSCQGYSYIWSSLRLWPTRLLCPWNFPGKKHTGVGCHFLLQGIFLTQGSNSSLLHCEPSPPWQADSLPLSHQGSRSCSYRVFKKQCVGAAVFKMDSQQGPTL